MSNNFDFNYLFDDNEKKAIIDVTQVSSSKNIKAKKMYIVDIQVQDTESDDSFFVYQEQKNSKLYWERIINYENLFNVIQQSTTKSVDMNSQEYKNILESLKEQLLERINKEQDEDNTYSTDELYDIKLKLINQIINRKKHD